MSVYCICVLVYIYFVSVIASGLITSSGIDLSGVDGKSLFRSLRASTCKEDCSSVKFRPVCGTDGLTYNSRCELKKAKKCDGRKVKVRKKGACDGDTGGSKCLREKEEARAAIERKKNEVFEPACNEDGTFAEVQCHSETGYCWCFTKDGRHVPGTSVSGKRPRCRGKRRKRKQKGRSRKRKACNRTDRQSFNSDLVRVFSDEYKRWMTAQPTTLSSKAAEKVDDIERQRKIVDWKFSELDRDNDGVLKFKEIRSFARMVRKLIKPRSCAKRFLKYCDSSGNKKIEKSEWTLCLGVEFKFSFQLFVSLNSDGQPEDSALDNGRSEGRMVDALRRSWKTSLPSPSLSHTATPRKEDVFPRNGLSPFLTSNNNLESRSCLEEQRAARLSHREEPQANIYIPRCTDNGKWAKAQCHEATQYCWCVEEEKGTPIPGTSTFKQEPNCTMQKERDMKGCPFQIKRKFLMDLMSDLSEEMASISGNNNVNTVPNDTSIPMSQRIAQWKASRVKVAEWKLLSLDTNKNKVLERKEWKKFRKSNLKAKKYPRKCRRNFLRFCDMDKNKQVTMTEWKECMGLNQNYYNSLPSNPHRTGKNPFSKYLHD
ncbi:SPARC-related modular calcium-binding protein 2 isoform X4 [Patella vulgata]|uniref:SPARC-related modular calcium-binding protein 2 isoform X4 n=1 Tax=Patella vulgata TaxID=6465 RepID=UPI00217F49F6|nr:SPARC-related modular calcium-binding protein 2 isoform X4 [Patella vulgata]